MVLYESLLQNIKNNKNSTLVKIFIKLIDQIKFNINKNKNDKNINLLFKLKVFDNAIKIIAEFSNEIISGKQLKNIKGIGKGTIDRIDEILTTGTLKEITTNFNLSIYSDILETVIGIGPVLSYKLITEFNIYTVQDLIKKYNSNLIKLPNTVIKGLKYYKYYKISIPRKEILITDIYLHKILKNINVNLLGIICGSYRRLKMESNDIDFLIVYNNRTLPKKNYLKIIINKLYEDGFLIDSFTETNEHKFMGICQLKYNNKLFTMRKIDLKFVNYDSYYTALLHFTGSRKFNINIRKIAKSLGYILNEYGLFKITKHNKFSKININSEKHVFDILGLEYVKPELR
jgi:DNA polymerase/3'-5' exonuclease PolX